MVYFWDNILEVVSIQWNELGLQRFEPIRRYIGRIKQQKRKEKPAILMPFLEQTWKRKRKSD